MKESRPLEIVGEYKEKNSGIFFAPFQITDRDPFENSIPPITKYRLRGNGISVIVEEGIPPSIFHQAHLDFMEGHKRCTGRRR